MLAHVDGDVCVDHFHRNLLPGSEEADPSSVAGVEVGLPRLNAPRALQEGLLIHHHLVACKVCEVYVIHLASRNRAALGGGRGRAPDRPRALGGLAETKAPPQGLFLGQEAPAAAPDSRLSRTDSSGKLKTASRLPHFS